MSSLPMYSAPLSYGYGHRKREASKLGKTPSLAVYVLSALIILFTLLNLSAPVPLDLNTPIPTGTRRNPRPGGGGGGGPLAKKKRELINKAVDKSLQRQGAIRRRDTDGTDGSDLPQTKPLGTAPGLKGRSEAISDARGAEVRDRAPEARVAAPASGVYQYSAVDIDGKERSLGEFQGRVTLIVNVASKCGYTQENYANLEPLYEKYKDKGFTVLAFPSNEFGEQEPGEPSDIKEFCRDKYGVTFPIFQKTEVNGPRTHPVFRYLKSRTPYADWSGGRNLDPNEDPAQGKLVWNFQKFLVDASGEPRFFFYHNFDKDRIEAAVRQLLGLDPNA